MDLKNISKQEFAVKMESLNIQVGDIVYIETQCSPDFFNPILINRFLGLLLDYLKDEGTIVMSLAGYNKDLTMSELNEEMLVAFNEKTMSLYAKSKLATYLQSFEGAHLSSSTFFPFVALVSKQSYDFPNGTQSPFARLYELRAKALLIDHNIKDFLLNEHCVEVSKSSTVYIDSGVDQKHVVKFMRKKEKDLTKILFSSKKYKELFYYTDYKDVSLLSISVRDYVDFCVRIIEG